MQAVPPSAAWYVPAGHSSAWPMPAKGQKWPAVQGRQSAAASDPSCGAKLPAGQGVQSTAPGRAAYVPAGHAWHGAVSLPPPPPRQATPGDVAWRPTGHGRHAPTAAAPLALPYVPAGQDLQRVAAAALE